MSSQLLNYVGTFKLHTHGLLKGIAHAERGCLFVNVQETANVFNLRVLVNVASVALDCHVRWLDGDTWWRSVHNGERRTAGELQVVQCTTHASVWNSKQVRRLNMGASIQEPAMNVIVTV